MFQLIITTSSPPTTDTEKGYSKQESSPVLGTSQQLLIFMPLEELGIAGYGNFCSNCFREIRTFSLLFFHELKKSITLSTSPALLHVQLFDRSTSNLMFEKFIYIMKFPSKRYSLSEAQPPGLFLRCSAPATSHATGGSNRSHYPSRLTLQSFSN